MTNGIVAYWPAYLRNCPAWLSAACMTWVAGMTALRCMPDAGGTLRLLVAKINNDGHFSFVTAAVWDDKLISPADWTDDGFEG